MIHYLYEVIFLVDRYKPLLQREVYA
jgi:hypothetical protein